MRTDWKHLDKWRNQHPPYNSPPGARFGAFSVKHNSVILNIIATDGLDDNEQDFGWEHVSVHAVDTHFNKQRIPTWLEMCFVKDLFWESHEVVIQLHVANSDHINIHECVLHLWRPTKATISLPPKAFV